MRSVGNPSELSAEDIDLSPSPAPALRLLPGGGGGSENAEVSDLRTSARRALVAGPHGTEPLAELWEALVTGREHAVLSYSESGRCFLVVRGARADERLPSLANARNLTLLTRVLLGEPQKNVAVDFKISASSVAAIAAQYAEAMGFGEGVSRLPILLVMAAHAAAKNQGASLARSASFVHDSVPHRVLAVAVPDPARFVALSAAECEVVAFLLARYQNAEIAELRHTSSRTVANQVCSVMRKVGARGRSEIISKMIEGNGC